MKVVIRLVIFAAIIIGALMANDAWQKKKRQTQRAANLQEQAEQQRRDAIVSGQQPTAPPAGVVIDRSQVSAQTERRFRDLAQRNGVTITEFTSINSREAAVGMQARTHTAIPDLLDAARREGILWDFDDDMMSRNNRPGGGGIQTRTTITFQ